MIQFGVRLHDGEPLPLPVLLPRVRERGFSCVHLALSKSLRDCSTAPAALTPGFAQYLKRLFLDHRLDIAVLGCYDNLAHPDDAARAAITQRYLAHLRFAAWLGCGVVGTETGAPNAAYRYEPACHTEAALDTFCRNLQPVVRAAEQLGVVIAIEPVWKHIVSTPARARKVLDRLASPNLQIIFDPVNLLCRENHADREAIFAEALELLGPDIAVVHLKDYVDDGTELRAVAAGNGCMDYRAILCYLQRHKPFVQASLENTTPENAAAACAFLKQLAAAEGAEYEKYFQP